MDRSILIKYKQIKIKYQKLILKAKHERNNWLDVVANLLNRRDRELERYLETHTNR